MYVCMYVFMYSLMNVCMCCQKNISVYICVCMHVCMYEIYLSDFNEGIYFYSCMYVYICTFLTHVSIFLRWLSSGAGVALEFDAGLRRLCGGAGVESRQLCEGSYPLREEK